MSDLESKIKEENEHIKELFNFNGDETQLKSLKELFTKFILNSNNGPNYFLKLLEHYSLCRPHEHHISRELIECVYSCFPEQINEIQHIIKRGYLKFSDSSYFQKNSQHKEPKNK